MDKKPHAIVFDLDETLGSFSQLYKFWHLLKVYFNNENLNEKYFFSILDLFPDFLRTDIFKVLRNIRIKKQNGLCDFVMIYTNNNGPFFWANLIKSYFHYKLKYNLFDQIIRAFKIDGTLIEVCRTSYEKSFRDFLSCTKLPPNTQICFLDDQYHSDMEHENVLYINLQPYNYNIEYSVLIKKFYKRHKKLFDKFNFSLVHFKIFMHKNTLYDALPFLNKTPVNKNMDYLITHHILNEINLYFKTPVKKYTYKKIKREKKKQTKKK